MQQKIIKTENKYIQWVRWLRLTKKERKAIKQYRKEKKCQILLENNTNL